MLTFAGAATASFAAYRSDDEEDGASLGCLPLTPDMTLPRIVMGRLFLTCR